jgi:hypothetical protein
MEYIERHKHGEIPQRRKKTKKKSSVVGEKTFIPCLFLYFKNIFFLFQINIFSVF